VQQRCRVELGEARFKAARASGRALALGEAIELALAAERREGRAGAHR
jgi:hypothetical protein